jgi:two-component system sensor histidine kinase PilS (NtrC family)
LGAISHAGQLLAEAEHLSDADHRLTEIIQTHTRRVNTIIENIMQLSRRQPTQPEELALGPWLNSFKQDFDHDNHGAADKIDMSINPENLLVRFDSSQLHQVISNLCQNGLNHGASPESTRIWLQAGISSDSHKPFLEVIDNGSGVAKDDINKLFEPFFTTSNAGTGLGLYIARELCESNQARLDYIPAADQGACFRITFADTRRHQVM